MFLKAAPRPPRRPIATLRGGWTWSPHRETSPPLDRTSGLKHICLHIEDTCKACRARATSRAFLWRPRLGRPARRRVTPTRRSSRSLRGRRRRRGQAARAMTPSPHPPRTVCGTAPVSRKRSCQLPRANRVVWNFSIHPGDIADAELRLLVAAAAAAHAKGAVRRACIRL